MTILKTAGSPPTRPPGAASDFTIAEQFEDFKQGYPMLAQRTPVMLPMNPPRHPPGVLELVFGETIDGESESGSETCWPLV